MLGCACVCVCVPVCEQAPSVTREVILLKGRGEEKVEFLQETLPKRRPG